MADAWRTYPIEFGGGLVTNISPLQQGANAPGTATKLINFEPSIEGGYKKIKGFSKFGTATVDSQTSVIRGLVRYNSEVIAARGQKLYRSNDGTSWTEVTGVGNLIGGSNKVKFAKYNFTGSEKLVIVDDSSKPFVYDGTTLQKLTNANQAFTGSNNVIVFKNHIFFANDEELLFSAPYEDPSSNPSSGMFSPANGAGSINIGANILDLVVFRDQLIIFTANSIKRLSGNTIIDFTLLPISDDLGAAKEDTAQEVGGDIMFLAADGLRFLSGTDRIGDFGLAVVSKPIQSDVVRIVEKSTTFASLVVREKSQYRLFGYDSTFTDESAEGIIATQFSPQGGDSIAWALTLGINAHVTYSEYSLGTEFIYFANDDGYVYQLESGNSFDGTNINAQFRSPFLPIEDPRIRKSFYKAIVYMEPEGSVDFDFSLIFDFGEQNDNIIQPEAINIASTQGDLFAYGFSDYLPSNGIATATTAKYAGRTEDKVFETQLIGSGFTAAVDIKSDDSNPPFSLDAITLEYIPNTKR